MKDIFLTALRSIRLARSLALGRRRLAALAAKGELPIPVFFYHRVADAPRNPCTIPFAVFERQMHLLKSRREVITLEEMQRRVASRESFSKAAAITFDDGYAENSLQALPLLVRLGLPCTYFVSVDNIRFGTPFPHDVKWGHPFPPHAVDDLRRWGDCGIEIGLHTRTHFDFSSDDSDERIETEVLTAAEELREMVRQPVRYFAFPYGMPEQLRPRVINALNKAGFSGFCSAYGAFNHVGQDPFHIRRVHGDPEMTRFLNSMAIDYKKIGKDLWGDNVPQPPDEITTSDEELMLDNKGLDKKEIEVSLRAVESGASGGLLGSSAALMNITIDSRCHR